MLLTILIIISCIVAGLATIFIGLRPVEENYSQETRRRLLRLTWIYGAATVVFLVVILAFQRL